MRGLSKLDSHIKETLIFKESTENFKERVTKALHKHGNFLDTHVKEIHSIKKDVDKLMEAREAHQIELINIKNQQAQNATAMNKVSESLDNLTKKIGELFTIKNMVIGGFASVVFLCGITLAAVKLYLDYRG